jgi:hypothetical protein
MYELPDPHARPYDALESQSRAFNFPGDTTICWGTVIDKRIGGLHSVVDLKLAGTNQRGEITAPDTAPVILSSRNHGPVVLPVPPEESRRRGAEMVANA